MHWVVVINHKLSCAIAQKARLERELLFEISHVRFCVESKPIASLITPLKPTVLNKQSSAVILLVFERFGRPWNLLFLNRCHVGVGQKPPLWQSGRRRFSTTPNPSINKTDFTHVELDSVAQMVVGAFAMR
jgi:hypothetical protein